jgi:hypothetical protein
MDESFYTARMREAAHTRRCLDVHVIDGYAAALDIKADGIDCTIGYASRSGARLPWG